MVDSFNPNPDPVAAPGESAASGGFLATRNGRIAIGGIALVAILLALVGVYYVYTTSQATQPPDGFVTQGGSQPTTGTPSVNASATPPPTVDLDEAFPARNIFEPTVKPRITSTSSGGTSGGTTGGSTSGGGTDSPDTLYLLSLSEQDGRSVATFRLNGTEYTVGEGERLGDTPWSVVSISSTQVVLLYGDTRVTITLGQGVSK